jgi:hypothetical protein
MPRNWIDRNTTANDLLDDGVENFSDVRAPESTPAKEGTPDPAAIASKQRTRDAVQSDLRRQLAIEWRRAWSPFGIGLGLALIVAGTLEMLFPADMIVRHPAMKSAGSVEHVTPDRAMFYGGVIVAVGVALVAFAVVRPRKR